MIELTHEEIVKRCVELDEMKPRAIVYFLDINKQTRRLGYSAMFWSHLDQGERYCMVKYGNYFLTEEDAMAAVVRAMTKPLEEVVC